MYMDLNKLNMGVSKRLAATGILALGVGSYHLLAQTVGCGGQTIAFCAQLCSYAGSQWASCGVNISGPTLFCGCESGVTFTVR
jgi:hypothetical protein